MIQRYRDVLPLSLNMPGLKFMGRRGAEVDHLDVIAISAPRVPLCWWGAACNLPPSTLQRSYPIRGFHVVSRRRALQFTILEMSASRPVHLTRQAVARTLTVTPIRRDDVLVQR